MTAPWALALPIGIGATLATDLWALALRSVLGLRPLDWALVGRWLGHLPRGRFVQPHIAQAEPIPGERAIGWLAHYTIGVVFATTLLALAGPDWARRPSLLPALGFGVVTVIFPYALLMPGLGAGFAAARTPTPNLMRLRSLLTHAVFGLGLYASASLCARLLAD
jgi:hypothetical protein